MPRGCPRLRLGTAAVGTLPARVHGGPIKEQTRTGWSRLLLDFGMRLALSRPIDHSRNSYVPRNGAGLIFYVPVTGLVQHQHSLVALLTVLDHRQRRIRFAQAHAVGQDAAVATSSAAYPAWTGWATPGGILRAVTDTVRSTATARATGVGVEAGQKEAIINLNVVMVYGHRIPNVVQTSAKPSPRSFSTRSASWSRKSTAAAA